MMRKSLSTLSVLLLGALSTGAQAEEVTVMISGGFKAALEKLIPDYEKQSGNHLVVIPGPSMGKTPQAIPNRLARGEQADVVIMVGDALTHLQQDKRIATGTRTELADSPIGIVVKKGDALPAIGTDAELRKTLLQAKSVAYSDSASGRYVSHELFKKLGIDQEMQTKAQMVERIPVASQVAQGRYALGFQQVSELLPVPGVSFVGELPANVQYITRFAGAVTVNAQHPDEGKALLRFLASPQAQKTVTATGMHTVPATARQDDTVQ
jgi:molybdate transport system substrate-binding protein